jgi:DNA-directed RNA polymerase alpha subunit
LFRLQRIYRRLRSYRSDEGVGAVKSYRDYLAIKGLKPIVIERTAKRNGDRVLVSSCMPLEIVKNNVEEMEIEEFPFSVRTRRAMINGFSFHVKVKDVVGTPANVLMRLPNFGRKSLNEWNQFCAENGLEQSV